jgi:hypothetical protein
MTQDDSRNEDTYLLNLLNMDRFLTGAMGGPLASLPDIPEQARILDLACGPGGCYLESMVTSQVAHSGSFVFTIRLA